MPPNCSLNSNLPSLGARKKGPHFFSDRVNPTLHGRPCDYRYGGMPNEEQLQTQRGRTLDPARAVQLGPWVKLDEPTGPPRGQAPRALQGCPSPAGSPELRQPRPHQPAPIPPWPGVTPRRGGKSQLPSEAFVAVTGGSPRGPRVPERNRQQRAQPGSRWHSPNPFGEAHYALSLCPVLADSVGGSRASVSRWEQSHHPTLIGPSQVPLPPLFSPFPLFLPKGVWGLCSALLPSSGWALTWRVRSGPAPRTPDRESTVPTSVPGRHAKRGPKPTYFILAPQRGKIFYFF